MKRFIVMVLVALSFYSCTNSMDDNGNGNQNCGDVRNIAFESFNYCGELKNKPTTPVYVIINSAEQMVEKFTTCETFVATLPDFTQKQILGLFSGSKPSGGYEMHIQSVIENDCQMLVEYSEKVPSDGENVTMGITYPADYVILPKSSKPIVFSKVKPIENYAVVGTYVADPAVSECVGDCNQFFRMEKYKVVKYLNVSILENQLNKSGYKGLVFIDDYEGFLLKVPTEIKELKGKTKTFGTPGTDNHGGVYFEWSEAGVVTKIYLDNTDSADQTSGVVAFKKVIQNKVGLLGTKN